jgi:hypothetical protein
MALERGRTAYDAVVPASSDFTDAAIVVDDVGHLERVRRVTSAMAKTSGSSSPPTWY